MSSTRLNLCSGLLAAFIALTAANGNPPRGPRGYPPPGFHPPTPQRYQGNLRPRMSEEEFLYRNHLQHLHNENSLRDPQTRDLVVQSAAARAVANAHQAAQAATIAAVAAARERSFGETHAYWNEEATSQIIRYEGGLLVSVQRTELSANAAPYETLEQRNSRLSEAFRQRQESLISRYSDDTENTEAETSDEAGDSALPDDDDFEAHYTDQNSSESNQTNTNQVEDQPESED